LFFDYHRQHGVAVKVARIFNTYGPRMQPADGRVVSNFIVQALRNQPITLYGDGAQTRSFCYVNDLIGGLIALMDSAPTLTGPLNLGNPHEFSMRELAEAVLDLTGSKSKLTFKPLPADDPKQRKPDIHAAQQQLGWMPQVALADGLTLTIAYFEKLLGIKQRKAKSTSLSLKKALHL
jgi:UDP-glucuronate decarboxylase